MLNSGHIQAAFLDVFNHEQNPNRALVEHKRVLASPHIGGMTYEALENVGRAVIAQAEDLIDRRQNKRAAHKLLEASKINFTLEDLTSISAKVDDIGDTGMGILTAFPLEAGEVLTLNLSPNTFLEFNVAWSAQVDVGTYKVGLKSCTTMKVDALESQILQALPHLEERSLNRNSFELREPTSLKLLDGRQYEVSILNMSTHGYGLTTFHPLDRGMQVYLLDPYRGEVLVEVVWCSQEHSYSYQIGVKLAAGQNKMIKESA